MNDAAPSSASAEAVRFRKAFLLLLVLGISLLFLLMIRRFLLAVFLAAIFAGLTYPVYRWLRNRFRGREKLASVSTILLLLLGVGLPSAAFLTLVTAEAVQVVHDAADWIRDQEARINDVRTVMQRIPFGDQLIPDAEQIAQQVRLAAAGTGTVLMGILAAATRGTLTFLLQAFIFLYALFYFLTDGPNVLRRILSYLPLAAEEEERLLERFVSVARATLKGSLLIGVIQGGVAAIAFWIAGVPGAALWGTIMIVLSIVPAVGASLVWVPAVIYLFLVGRFVAAILLLAWCAVVVSSLDNLLRPRLIGRDARMSDLLILLSTLGGIVLFGAVGFVVGPIVAALFVTVWLIFGEAFRDWLPKVPERILELGPPVNPPSSNV